MKNREMQIEFCLFTYHETENNIVVLDAKNKVLAVFPFENRDRAFVRDYVALMFRFFGSNAFASAMH